MNESKMYGVLCESDGGIDLFGNPIGKPILWESIGEGLTAYNAITKAEKLNKTGRYGRCIVVLLKPIDSSL